MSRTRYLWIGSALALLAFAGGPIRAGDDPPKEKQEKKATQTPDERYQALLKEFNDAMASFQTIYQNAKTDEERQKAMEKYPQPQTYFDKFLKLAEDEPKSKVAFDALMWIGTKQGSSDVTKKALDLLIRDHIDNERLGDIAAALQYQISPDSERFLREVLEKSAARTTKALACLTLARYLSSVARLVDQIADAKKNDPQAEMVRNYLGKDYAAKLVAKGREGLDKESEGLFERAKKEFADVKTFRGTVGEQADNDLFELRNLAIGKPRARDRRREHRRQAAQAERLQRQGGRARFLRRLVRPLPGHVPARAVAREALEGQAVRSGRHQQRHRQGRFEEATQGRKHHLAVLVGRRQHVGSDRDPLEYFRLADDLRPRLQRGHSLPRRPRGSVGQGG